jgi:hypothetical protein
MLVAPTAVVQPMEVAQEARPQLLEWYKVAQETKTKTID